MTDLARRGAVRQLSTPDGRWSQLWELVSEPWCDAPITFELWANVSARGSAGDDGWIYQLGGRNDVRPLGLIGKGPCRKCERCLKMRRRFWEDRAVAEYKANPRTFFGTITMSPDEHYLLDARATARLAEGQVRFGSLSGAEMFKERCREYGLELTRYFKRIRAGRGGHKAIQLRYMLVAEAHDGPKTSPELRGRPHFHIVLHESEVGTLVEGDPLAVKCGEERSGEFEVRFWKSKTGRWHRHVYVHDDAFLRTNWQLGFTKFQFAESPQMATYACKYLSKSLLYKVRASYRYGLGPLISDDNEEGNDGTSETSSKLAAASSLLEP